MRRGETGPQGGLNATPVRVKPLGGKQIDV